MRSASNSNFDDNPFDIFKSYRVNFKDQCMEKAYQTQKTMIRPFNILKLMIYYLIILTSFTFLMMSLNYFGYFRQAGDSYTFWFFVNLGALILLLIANYLVNKYPDYHNLHGSLGILAITAYLLESHLQVDSHLVALI